MLIFAFKDRWRRHDPWHEKHLVGRRSAPHAHWCRPWVEVLEAREQPSTASLATAQPLVLAADNSATQTATLSVPGEVDVYSFVAQVSGAILVEQEAAAASSVTCSATVLDAQGQQIVAGIGTGDISQADLNVVAGETYYIEASAGNSGTTGAYVLSIAPSTPITPAADGSATQNGTIEDPAEVDVYQFTATTAGSVIVSLAPAADSSLQATLGVTDSAGNSYSITNFGSNDGTSQVALTTVVGQTYYLQGSTGTSGTTGAYVLSITPYTNDFGNDNANAFPLTLAADGTATQNGTIEVSGDVDVFKFTATTAGPAVINLVPASGSTLNTNLNVTDSAGTYYNTTYLGVNETSGQVALNLVVGKTYFIQAGGYSGIAGTTPTGAYVLTVMQYQTSPLILAADGSATQNGTIEMPGEVDVYKFTATTAGPAVINLVPAPGSTWFPTLKVTDSAGNSYSPNYLGFGVASGQVALNLVVGQTYFIQAGGSSAFFGSASTGAYVLTVVPYQASPLTLAADGSATQDGTIETPGEVDVYKFTATISGSVAITLAPPAITLGPAANSALVGTLTVTDSAGNSYPTTIVGNLFSTSQVALSTEAGKTYYLQVSGGYYGATGAYVLTVMPFQDDYGHDIAHASPLTVAADGSATQNGTIAVPADVDVFQFTATTAGSVIIGLALAANSSLQAALSVTDSAGNSYAPTNFGSNDGTSLVAVTTVVGQTYYLQASAGLSGTTGAYVLTITPYADDFGNDNAHAFPLTLAAGATTTQNGTIEVPGDVDVFTFTATTAGPAVINLAPATGSTLNTNLSVTDSAGDFFPTTYLGANAATGQVALNLVVGQTYFIQAGGYSGISGTLATGAYVLTVNEYQATLITLAADGSATLNDTIENQGDVGFFKFTAVTAGPVAITVAPAPGSTLNTSLSFTDSSNTFYNTTYFGPFDATGQVALDTVLGQTYFIQVGGNGSTGAYVLTVMPFADTYGNNDANAYPLTLAADGSATLDGTIVVPAQVDVFKFTATTAGTDIIDLAPADASALNTTLFVTDSQGNYYPTTYTGANNATSQVVLNTVPGLTYYLQASAYYGTTGAYALSIVPYVDNNFDDANASPLMLAADGTATQTGTIEAPSEVNVFEFTATTAGPVVINLAPAAGSALESNLLVTDGSGNSYPTTYFGSNFGTSEVALDTVVGQTYYLQASSYNITIGAYVLTVAPYADDYGNDAAHAYPITLPPDRTGTQPGTIEVPADVDCFQFTPTLSGVLSLQVDYPADSTLDGTLTILDASGNIINDSGLLSNENEVAVNAGQTFYAEVSSADGSVGTYLLSYSLAAAPAIATPNVEPFTMTEDTPASFTITTDSGLLTPQLTEKGMLPTGVTFTDNHDGTATLAGVPLDGQEGTYTFTIMASNADGTSAPRTFVLNVLTPAESANVLSADTVLAQGGQASASVSGTSGSQAMVDIKGAGDTAALYLASYTNNPTGVTPDVSTAGTSGSGANTLAIKVQDAFVYLDMRVTGASADSTATAVLTFPASAITPGQEGQVEIRYFDGNNWLAVTNDDGSVPVPIAQYDANNKLVGWKITLNFGTTSTPVMASLTGTVFTVALPTAGQTNQTFVNVSSGAQATQTVYVTVLATNQYFPEASTSLVTGRLLTSNTPGLYLFGKFTDLGANLPPEVALLAQTNPFAGFSDPRSALQALSQDNSPDSYLSYRGTPLSLSVVDVAASAAIAQGTNLPAGDLILVATLQAGRLTESFAATRTGAAPGERTYALFLPPNPVADHGIREAAAEVEPGRLLPRFEAPWERFPLGATEALRQRLELQRARERLKDLLHGLQDGFERFQDWLWHPATPGPVSRGDSPVAVPAALIATAFALGMALQTPEEKRQIM